MVVNLWYCIADLQSGVFRFRVLNLLKACSQPAWEKKTISTFGVRIHVLTSVTEPPQHRPDWVLRSRVERVPVGAALSVVEAQGVKQLVLGGAGVHPP